MLVSAALMIIKMTPVMPLTGIGIAGHRKIAVITIKNRDVLSMVLLPEKVSY